MQDTIYRETFDNGAGIVVHVNPASPTISLGFVSRSGADRDAVDGTAHFLEHCLFKGERGRETTRKIESLGSSLNAHTGYDQLFVFAEVIPKYAETVASLLFDLYSNDSFDEDEVDSERNVINGEISRYLSTPINVFRTTAFKKIVGEQYHSPLGSVESLKSVNRDVLLEYKNAHMRENNTSMLISGVQDEAEIPKWVNIARELLSGSERGVVSDHARPSPRFEDAIVEVSGIDPEAAYVVHYFDMGEYDFQRNLNLMFLSNLIGSSMSGPFFRRFRDELAVGYAPSFLGWTAEVGERRSIMHTHSTIRRDMVDTFKNEMKVFVENLEDFVTDEAIGVSKNRIMLNHLSGFGNSFSGLMVLEDAELAFSKFKFPKDILKSQSQTLQAMENIDKNSILDTIAELSEKKFNWIVGIGS